MSAVICSYKRSPFTPAKRGELAKVNPVSLMAQTIASVVPDKIRGEIEDVIIGCAFPEGEQGFNIAKLSATLAGLPETVAGVTVNRFCGSSMEALHIAAGKIAMGAGDAFIVGGVESMSRIPMGGFNPLPSPQVMQSHPSMYVNMGITAENVAKEFDVARLQQDKFALESNRKASANSDIIQQSITPITRGDGVVVSEDGFNNDVTFESLSKKKPAFLKGGSVTSGNSSPLTDGASAMLVCSEYFAYKNGLTVLARIKSTAVSGCNPTVMGMSPVSATLKALKRVQLTVNDMSIVELNEAFASQSVACISQLGIDRSRVNVNGGALAVGHPLGASGVRIVGQAVLNLNALDGRSRYALATMCIGGGIGIATILERV